MNGKSAEGKHCPSRETLRKFSIGDLAPLEVERVAWHLTRSPDCSCLDVLNSFENQPDRLIESVQQTAIEQPHVDEPACRDLLRRAESSRDGNDRLRSSTCLAREDRAGEFESSVTSSRLVQLGSFRIEQAIGHGGMGEVYQAIDERVGRRVAIKLIRRDRFSDADSLSRFREEAETAARLDHPNIVPVYEVNLEEEPLFIVLKLIDGRPLSKLKETIVDDPRRAAQIVATIAHAMHYAHQRRIIHRDLKPHNILVDSTGTPFVTDFGLAKRIDADPRIADAEGLVGTPGYLSPEQAVGGYREITTSTDVYGLGGVLYYLLTGHPPLAGKQSIEILRQVVDRPPVSPRQLNARIDRDLEAICLKCLAKDPARRYASAEELAQDLERWLGHEPIVARDIGRPQRLARWCRRRPLVASLTGIALVLALVVAIGGPVAALSIHRRAIATKRSLFESQLALARAERESDRPDHRHVALTAIQQAIDAAESFQLSEDERLRLRNETVAALAFPNVRLVSTWPVSSAYPSFDAGLNHVAYATSDGKLVVCRMDNGQELARFDRLNRTQNWLQLSPNAEYVAVPALHPDRRELALFSVATGSRLWVKNLDLFPGRALFSPDEKLLAVGTRNRELQVIETATGKVRNTISGVDHEQFAWHPGGRWITYVDGNDVVHSMDAETGDAHTTYNVPADIDKIAWFTDGDKLTVTSGSNVLVWEAESAQFVRTFQGHQTSPIVTVSHGPAGRVCASAGHTGRTVVWNPASGQVLTRLSGRYPHCSWKEPYVAIVGASDGRHHVQLWRTEPSQELVVRELDDTARSPVYSMALSSDGRHAATVDWRGLSVWHMPDWKLAGRLALSNAFGVVALPEPGTWLVNSGNGLAIAKVDLVGGQGGVTSDVVTATGWSRFHQLATSRDGRQIAFSCGSSRVALLDMESNESHRIDLGNDEAPVAVSPDGELFVSITGDSPQGEVVVWEFATGKRMARIGSCDRGYNRICFSNDGRKIVVGSVLNYVCFCRGRDGSWFESFSIPRGERGTWGAAVFSPDDRSLAAIDTRQVIKIFDADSGKERCTLLTPKPRPSINCLGFDHDGRHLFAGCEQQQLHFWNLERIRNELSDLGLDW